MQSQQKSRDQLGRGFESNNRLKARTRRETIATNNYFAPTNCFFFSAMISSCTLAGTFL